MGTPFDWPDDTEPPREYAFDGRDPMAVAALNEGFVAPPANPAIRPEWSVALVTDVALGVSEDSIQEAHGLTPWTWDAIKRDVVFQASVARLREELKKDGATFTLKCKLQAEQLIDTSWQLIHDPATDPRVKAKLIADTIRWAGFDKSAGAGGGSDGLMININLNGAVPKQGSVYDMDSDDA